MFIHTKMSWLVDKKVLDVFRRYDNDLSLLDERWAKKKDRDAVSSEQVRILSSYVDKLEFLKVDNLSKTLRKSTEQELAKLEKNIHPDVVQALKSDSLNGRL